jgi:protoheme IX farnesyltransferase
MARTRQRALVRGLISPHGALLYASILGLLGFALVALFVNWQVVLIGLVGFIDYIALYGLAKRRSVHGTVVGSISGAAPIVAGYVAVTNRFDVACLLLFVILVAWQMPHFYAIALYRANDYAQANIPVLPLKAGIDRTRQQIMAYIGLFIIANAMLTVLGYTGYVYLAVMTLIGIIWLGRGLRQQFDAATAAQWGRQMFLFSLIAILTLSVMLSVGAKLA